MANFLRNLAILALLTTSATLGATQASGSGRTTRYWDCCKSSCAWPGKAAVSAPVSTCDVHDRPIADPNASSGCDGGWSYMCSDQSPWAVSDDLAYGFASVNIAGGTESSWCCACYELTFTSGPVAGKKMVVQATNTGGDLANNQFDLSIPGGGVGLFNGCSNQWGAPSSGWGQQYGGISSNTCNTFPSALQPGCNFRYDWFQGADNPSVDFKQVSCPAALTAKTGCVRNDDGPQYVGSSSASSSVALSSSTVASVPGAYSSSSVSQTSTSASGSLVQTSTLSAPTSSAISASSSSIANYSSAISASSSSISASSSALASSSTTVPSFATVYYSNSTSSTPTSSSSASGSAPSVVTNGTQDAGKSKARAPSDDEDTCEP